MGYVQKFREKLGHAPLALSASMCILYDVEKGILMERRSDTGDWCIPGGGLELGESELDGLHREVKEETNLEIFNPELFYVRANVHMVYPNGDEVYYTDIVFIVKEYIGELKPDKESVQLCWFKVNELPENIMPTQLFYVQKFVEDLQKGNVRTLKIQKR